ncbi:MAG TPA: class I SAM-dependent methyltransferase [Chloroflexota bacterium]|nr:class I SAM-dependent methyltransferase [Chloroflexota bacterium]
MAVLTEWPKRPATLTREQEAIREDFMHFWHEELPKRYSAIERFNQGFPAGRRDEWAGRTIRTLEVGAGLGEHLAHEDLSFQEYTALELRATMAERIKQRYPDVRVLVGDVQERLAAEDGYFDRIVAVHVLDHLPDLPAALQEIRRVLKPGGHLAAVIPCEGGIAYGIGRDLTSRRLFETRYRCSYDWFIRAEHVNTCAEILKELNKVFTVKQQHFWPFRIPVIHANAVVGLICTPR